MANANVFSAFHVFTDCTHMPNKECYMMEKISDGYAKKNPPLGIIFIQTFPENSLVRAKNIGYPSDIQLSLDKVKFIDEK